MRDRYKTNRPQLALAITICSLAILTHSLPARAQTVQGHVLESQTTVPVQSAAVMLLDTTFTAVAGTASNPAGAFILTAPSPGSFYVLTEALGYTPSIDGILELGDEGVVTVEIYLKPKPIILDSIKVAVERAQVFQHLEMAGFNERMVTGFGHFITPEEIRQRNPRYFSDLFRNAPGVRLIGGGALQGTEVEYTIGSIRGPSCSPPVYVDGTLVNAEAEYGGLEGVVDISQIAAVEIYTRASNVPLQWGGTNAGCGVLLIWTR